MGIQLQSISTEDAETEMAASTAELDITIEMKHPLAARNLQLPMQRPPCSACSGAKHHRGPGIRERC
ncbi:hypothetical protein D1BOALGB6SA_8868 [Olavius sp. associated proteobacterium Delta 1]|nr:hypothetical protein D1BOALGB6SA_8868 [Olavius sp. associated proteobacterium Delta 1]